LALLSLQRRSSDLQQRFLASASKALASSLEVDATLERAAAAMAPDLADWCCVEVPDERGRLRRRAIAAPADRRAHVAALRDALGRHPAGGVPEAVLRDGRPRLAAQLDDAALREWATGEAGIATVRGAGLRSLLAVPLMVAGRVTGVMTMGTDESARTLGATELDLAREIGVRAGIAVENARLHAARTHIATTLQRSLLPPRLPAVPGITLAARFRAAGEASEVGGDFYDVFGVEGAWMIVIGDVTGKGPEAASITSLARYTMRTAAAYEPSPGAVLRRLNAALVVDPDRRQICTVAAARVAPRSDGSADVAVACGGHPAPFRLHDGSAEAVAAAGPLLGAFERGHWPEAAVRLAPGDSLVLYTDGVTDTRSRTERFGAERLAGVLAGATGLEPDEVANRVDEALVAFEDGPQRDDVALVILRASGGAATGGAAPLRDASVRVA
jgi:serine phosphatase RsbU (regulator of sigma subunit)